MDEEGLWGSKQTKKLKNRLFLRSKIGISIGMDGFGVSCGRWGS
jgi:hypothetical protein